eukprot:787953-Amphidinium_carterae.1
MPPQEIERIVSEGSGASPKKSNLNQVGSPKDLHLQSDSTQTSGFPSLIARNKRYFTEGNFA